MYACDVVVHVVSQARDPIMRRLRQEYYHEFETNLDYITGLCLKNTFVYVLFSIFHHLVNAIISSVF